MKWIRPIAFCLDDTKDNDNELQQALYVADGELTHLLSRGWDAMQDVF